MPNIDNICWPGWETVRLIGRGSFGSVYEIQRNVFGDVEKAALKVISIPQNDSDISALYDDGYDEESITNTFKSHLQSIIAEYSLMCKLNGCANIVNCEDVRYVQHDDGIGWDIFIKMELLTPLTKVLPAEIQEETVVKLAKDICNALILCKRLGIVYRDVAPQNILVSANGDYKLGDFAIRKTIEEAACCLNIGMCRYAAPEVYTCQSYGPAADVYSLGLVLYWMLNERRLPFLPLPPEKVKPGMEEKAIVRRFSGDEDLPAPACGSEDLKRIVLKACAFDIKNRYESALEMLQDLNQWCTVEESRCQEEQEKEYIAKEQDEKKDTSKDDHQKDRLITEQQVQPNNPNPELPSLLKIGLTMLLAVVLVFAFAISAGVTKQNKRNQPASPTTVNSNARITRTTLAGCEFVEDSNSAGSVEDVSVGNWTDCFGTTHLKSHKFWVIDANGYNDTEYTVYVLDAQFTKMDVFFALEENSASGATAYIKIYLDGELVKTSRTIGRDSVEEFIVNVTGAKQIRIECTATSDKHTYGIVDASVFSG